MMFTFIQTDEPTDSDDSETYDVALRTSLSQSSEYDTVFVNWEMLFNYNICQVDIITVIITIITTVTPPPLQLPCMSEV